MFTELWQAFLDWANDAWNWLKNFFSQVWESIVSWWDALRETIVKWLSEDDDEVDVLDLRTPIGRKIFDMIKENVPNTRSVGKYDNNLIALHFKNDGTLKEVANFETKKVENEDDFEKDLRKDGIIRLNK